MGLAGVDDSTGNGTSFRLAELRLWLIQELIFVRKTRCSAGSSIAQGCVQHGPCRLPAADEVRSAVSVREKTSGPGVSGRSVDVFRYHNGTGTCCSVTVP